MAWSKWINRTSEYPPVSLITKVIIELVNGEIIGANSDLYAHQCVWTRGADGWHDREIVRFKFYITSHIKFE